MLFEKDMAGNKLRTSNFEFNVAYDNNIMVVKPLRLTFMVEGITSSLETSIITPIQAPKCLTSRELTCTLFSPLHC